MQIFGHPHPPRKSKSKSRNESAASATGAAVTPRPSSQRGNDDDADRISKKPESTLSSILGVAFDDYIGEEGVLHPPSAAATAGGGEGGGGEWLNGNGGAGAGRAHASSEEDKRWGLSTEALETHISLAKVGSKYIKRHRSVVIMCRTMFIVAQQ